ncbi:MAG: ABC transporter transmembrane domain-containing protein [Pseudomonadota bacterium]
MSTFLLNVLGLLLPLATLHVFDQIIPSAAVETLAVMTLGLLGVVLAEFALRRQQSKVNTLASARYGSELSQAALSRLLTPSGEAARSAATGVQLERIDAIQRFSSFYAGGARMALVDLPFSFLALGLIWLIGGLIVAAPISIIILHFLLLGVLSSALRARIRDRRSIDIKSNDFLSEAFRMALTIKSWALENMIMRRFERLLAAATYNHRETIVLSDNAERHTRLVANLTTIFTLALGGLMAIQGEATIGVVAACTLLAGRAVQPAIRAAKGWSDVQRAALSADEIRPLFEGDERESPEEPEANDAATSAGPRAGRGAPRLHLAGANAELPPGSILAIDGGPNALTRQLLEAVAGLGASPEGGPSDPVTLDGIAPALYRRRNPGAIAFVSRAPQPFGGSIIDNLTVFGRCASDADALAAAERVGVDKELKKLPKGYQTLLATSSEEILSPAGAVKLAIARALAMEARLLVLEEPSAHLSAQDAALLRQELRRRSERGASSIILSTTDAGLKSIASHVVRIEAAPTPLALGESA